MTINPFKPRVIVTVSAAGEDHIVIVPGLLWGRGVGEGQAVIVPGVLWGRGVGEGQAVDNLYVSFITILLFVFMKSC